MEPAGWTATALTVVAGVMVVLHYTLDQVRALSAKAEKALVALRGLRAAWYAEEGRAGVERERPAQVRDEKKDAGASAPSKERR